MKLSTKDAVSIVVGFCALLLVCLLAVGGRGWIPAAAEDASAEHPRATEEKAEEKKEEAAGTEEKKEEAAGKEEECCKAGDTTPPTELVKRVPPGHLHSPYQDYAALAKEHELVKDFRLPGCNECHGGTGGGGFCPALTQGIWFWGNTDDVLFRLVTLGSAELEKSGFDRLQYGSVHAPMPPMGFSVKTGDDLWKIIAFIRSINPPGTNPPEKIVNPRMRQ
jgi:mono/diheme cytochrome c family protein